MSKDTLISNSTWFRLGYLCWLMVPQLSKNRHNPLLILHISLSYFFLASCFNYCKLKEQNVTVPPTTIDSSSVRARPYHREEYHAVLWNPVRVLYSEIGHLNSKCPCGRFVGKLEKAIFGCLLVLSCVHMWFLYNITEYLCLR